MKMTEGLARVEPPQKPMPMTITFRHLWLWLALFSVADFVGGPFLVHWQVWTKDEFRDYLVGDVSIAVFLALVWLATRLLRWD
jgi:hypothetical protein